MKYSVLHVCLLFFGFMLYPLQNYSQIIEWQKTIGGSAHDDLQSINPTSDGGFICGGRSESPISFDKTEASNGGHDFWIIKLNSIGNIEWQKTIGGSNEDYLIEIFQTQDGGYICAGTSDSPVSGDKTENCHGWYDYWIVKLDNSVNIEWQNTIGGTDADALMSFSATSDGGYICGGKSSSNSSADKSENCLGVADYWVVKLDSSGAIQWENTIGGSDGDYLEAIIQTADGGFICGGSSESPISYDKTENSQGASDYWIVKLNNLGIIEWQNTIGGSSTDNLKSIIQTFDGGFVFGGYSYSGISGDKTESCIGNSNGWVIKTNAMGNILWQNTLQGNSQEYVISIAQDQDGNIICGSMSDSQKGFDKTAYSKGHLDRWLVWLDVNGIIYNQMTLGGSMFDYLTSIKLLPYNEIICGGYSNSNRSGDKSQNRLGSYDYWVTMISNNCNLIQGVSFADINSNAIKDSAEYGLANEFVYELNSGRMAMTDENGFYSLAVLDSGNFEAISEGATNYYNSVPFSHLVNFSGQLQTDSLNDFAFQPIGSFNDLCVSLTPMGGFRAGMNASYMVNYSNLGTTSLSPIIIFYPGNGLTFSSSNPVPTSITNDSLVWNFGTLLPYQTGNILLTFVVDSGVPIGTLINSGVVIEPIIGDVNPICNQNYWEVFTTGSFDPNDIQVNRDTVLNVELISPPTLEYLIRFQNTGNDTAFYVRVGNNISPLLHLSTFNVVASSHEMNLKYSDHAQLMEFTFTNSLLPDSTTNEAESHGFIRYKIKPLSSLGVGDSILNAANIYFDFNHPVLTNTAITEIVSTVSSNELNTKSNLLSVYPNPFQDEINVLIKGLDGEYATMGIYDVYGRKIVSLIDGSISEDNFEIKTDLSELASGIYFIQLQTNGEMRVARIIKGH